jgi:signal peptidase I
MASIENIVVAEAGETAAPVSQQAPAGSDAPLSLSLPRASWALASFRRLLALGAILFGLRIFVAEASVVPTGSMERTVLVGDHILLDKLLYGPEVPLTNWRLPRWKTVRRGDIVVFRYPRDLSQAFIKRVAAVGGDRLEIRDRVVYLNSRRIAEPYAFHQRASRLVPEHVGPMVVPPNCLFVMGDNRDNSSDSRDWGFVPVDNVIGEPMFVYWSYDAPTADWLERSFVRRLAFDASIVGNFFTRTRWSRMGLRF